jgi:membrane protease YdiL (CAAX protease family)
LETLTPSVSEPLPPAWTRLALAAGALILFDFAAAILVFGSAVVIPRFDPLWVRSMIVAVAWVGVNACALVAAYQVAFAGRRPNIAAIGLAASRKIPSTVAIYIVAFFVVTPIGIVLTRAIGLDHGSTSIDTADRPLRARMVVAVLAVLVAPWIEEVAIRGLLLGALWSRFGFWIGAFGSGLVWASIHLTPSVLIIFTVEGALLAWVRRRTGSILTGIGLHGTQNTFATAFTGGGWAPVPIAGLLLASLLAANRYIRTLPS